MKRIFNLLGIIVLSLIIFSGCQENTSDPASVNSEQMTLSKGGIIHHVSVGGCDIVPPGVDRNFSLVANMDAEGNVSGQWQDTFGKDEFGNDIGRIHVAVDCLEILEPGNVAIVGGVITHGTVNGVDVSGQRAATMVEDNGQGHNSDPDRISYSYFPVTDCGAGVSFELFDIYCGQVKVKSNE